MTLARKAALLCGFSPLRRRFEAPPRGTNVICDESASFLIPITLFFAALMWYSFFIVIPRKMPQTHNFLRICGWRATRVCPLPVCKRRFWKEVLGEAAARRWLYLQPRHPSSWLKRFYPRNDSQDERGNNILSYLYERAKTAPFLLTRRLVFILPFAAVKRDLHNPCKTHMLLHSRTISLCELGRWFPYSLDDGRAVFTSCAQMRKEAFPSPMEG